MKKLLQVRGISQKGKARTIEFGCLWSVIRTGHRGYYVQSIEDETGKSKRWIDLPKDSDLEILDEITQESW